MTKERHPHMLTAPGDVLAFVTAGNARFTVVSKATGKRFSYRLRASHDGRVTFVGVLTGCDNESHYQYVGIIKDNVFATTARGKLNDAPSCHAFVFFWRHLIERKHVHSGLEVWHEGTCGRCGRTLTVPESIERGIGPECAQQMGLGWDQSRLATWASNRGKEQWS